MLAFISSLIAGVAGAATNTVTTCSGSGSGSLPGVVAASAPGDTITFSVICPPDAPITLDSSIDISQNLTIDGPGARDLAVSGNAAIEPFAITSAVTNATISGLTVEDGSASQGGGISNEGTLTIIASDVSGNSGSTGGGIYNAGTLTISGSTLSHNNALIKAGGIYNSGSLSLSDSTLWDNSATADGGGIDNEESLTVTSSTLSGNGTQSGGGGIDNDGDMTIGTTIVANSDTSGGDCHLRSAPSST